MERLLKKIRWMLVFFMVALALSGITAFPVYTELQWINGHQLLNPNSLLGQWLQRVWLGVEATSQQYPFMFYGYDWLAFAHLVIAMAFIGPYKNPVKNSWIIDWAMLACVAVIPLAVICGPIRQIPWLHILIDCSFGILGLIPLYLTRRWIRQLELLQYKGTQRT
jgi:hypothetical protein